MNDMNIAARPVTIDDYDEIYELWSSTEQSRRALNPVDDSREGIDRYLKRNPTTCFLAYTEEDPRHVIGVILTGHDGRRAVIHHMCIQQSVDEVLVIGLVILDIIIVIEVVFLIVLQKLILVNIVVILLTVSLLNEIHELLLGFVLIIDV